MGLGLSRSSRSGSANTTASGSCRLTVSTFASICNRCTHVLVKYPSCLSANCLETACVSGPPSTVPPREPETVLTGFQGEAHIANHHTSVRLPPRLPLVFCHQRSHHQQQEKATRTVANNTTAQSSMLLLRPPAEFAILRSARWLPRRLADHGYTVSYEGAHPPHHPVPESCIVHPSIIPPAGQR